MDTYDVVVVGAGAVGQTAAQRSARTGLHVALVESELVGGEEAFWACRPSKMLLRPGAVMGDVRAVPGLGAAELDTQATFAARDAMVSHWRDDEEVARLRGSPVTLLRGMARLAAERTVTITAAGGEQTVAARHAVIVATGSEPGVPDVPGLRQTRLWTSRDATSCHHVPDRLAVLGGGAAGVEAAQVYAALGAQVTVLARGSRLVPWTEPFVGATLADTLTAAGVRVLTGARAERVWRDPAGVHVAVAHGGAPVRVDADELLVVTGRHPATGDLGLDAVGLTPGDPLTTDASGQVIGVPGGWLYAAGDVTGRTRTTHEGQYHARVAGDVVAARFGVDLDARLAEAQAAPPYRITASTGAQVLFTRPQVAWTGLTLAQARQARHDVRVVDVDLSTLAAATVRGTGYQGQARFVVDVSGPVLAGATFVGPDVAELVHAATVAIVAQVRLDVLWHAVAVHPTLSQVWPCFLAAYGL
ncbi:MAG: NAD(P)/FAD-dependent oxidoreductase [Micrococcales bacterium]|nr:NAD(P)/FAD-dependent oxidoreductase [Micrococcales bacterium]